MFYIFSFVLAISAVLVVFSQNPVNSLLFLILAFFNAAGIFLIAGAEFLAMILIIIYVGAVVVLFLFVVMMLNFDMQLLRQELKPYQFISTLISAVVFSEMIFIFYFSKRGEFAKAYISYQDSLSNTHNLGNVLYTHYAYIFQISGLILLVAMVASITLTLQFKHNHKRQHLSNQLQRSPKNSLELVDIKTQDGMGKEETLQ